jgi:hypothetical protein
MVYVIILGASGFPVGRLNGLGWSAKDGPTMQDTALYQYLLGLQSPWTVSRVHLDMNEQRVDV